MASFLRIVFTPSRCEASRGEVVICLLIEFALVVPFDVFV
ncbi:unnamed protein product [Arabidopsis halleri]